jgi:hypothetical protein
MRKLIGLLAVLTLAILAGLPLAAHSAPATSATAAAVGPLAPTSTALICILPHCNGPYCRASNGCIVCCND